MDQTHLRHFRTEPLIRVVLIVAITKYVALGSIPGFAQTLNWINTTNSSAYFDADWNWNPSTVPGAGNRVVFGAAGNYDVWWDQFTPGLVPSVADLRVSQGRVRFLNTDPSGQWELRLNGSSGFEPLQVSGSGTRLTLQGVRLRSQGTASVTSGAELRVDGNHAMGSRLIVDGAMSVNGILDARNGGRMDMLAASLGTSAFDSRADVFVNGSGTQWNIQNDLTVGLNQNATLNLSGGARINNRNSTIASGLGTFCNAIVSGSSTQWNHSGNLTIGRDGDGFLWVNGGQVSNVNGSIGNGSGVGRVDVIGSTSRWDNTGSLQVFGSMNVGAGGMVNSTTGSVRKTLLSATPASVVIEGAGSIWGNNGNLSVTDKLEVRAGGELASLHVLINSASSTQAGEIAIKGVNSRMTVNGSLLVNGGMLEVSSGGSVTSGSTQIDRSGPAPHARMLVTDAGSSLQTFGNLRVGDNSAGELEIAAGAYVQDVNAMVATNGGSGIVRIDGLGSHWSHLQDLTIGSGGQVLITNNALVTTGRTTQIANGGYLQLDDGTFAFGKMTVESLRQVDAIRGVMSGELNNFGTTDVSSLTPLRTMAIDSSAVSLVNFGVLHGNANFLGSGLMNTAVGRVDVSHGSIINFTGLFNQNHGLIDNQGGRLVFGREMINESTGVIRGLGEFQAIDGWTNRGLMEFRSGISDILGNVLNESGRIHVVENGFAVFYGDVVHNGTEFHVETGSGVLFAGSLGGSGTISGAGAIHVSGALEPGNSAGTLEIDGNLGLLSSAATRIELGGLNSIDFDRLLIGGDFNIDGNLYVSLINGHTLSANEQYLIATIGGNRSGFWNNLGEGALVGNFGGRDLFITYAAGNGNGIGLFTAVPEPSSLLLITICLVVVGGTRRRR